MSVAEGFNQDRARVGTHGAGATRSVLVVEDDRIIALDLQIILESAGATVVGPAYELSKALNLIETENVNAAVIDYLLQAGDTLPLARVLGERGIPFLFQTSDPEGVATKHVGATILPKPYRTGPTHVSRVQPCSGDLETLDPGSTLQRICEKLMPATTNPVVEASPIDEGQSKISGSAALGRRIRQQELLAELGVAALRGTPFADLLNETVRVAADGLQAELCKVLEYMPSENRLLMRAGVGWDEGLVGVASVGADLASPSGYALRTGKPVIFNHLDSEERSSKRTTCLRVAQRMRRA